MGLHQVNQATNHMRRYLDLVLSNLTVKVVLSDISLTTPDLYHPPLFLSLIAGRFRGRAVDNNGPDPNLNFNFNRRDSSALSRRMSDVVWDFPPYLSCDAICECFYSTLNGVFADVTDDG